MSTLFFPASVAAVAKCAWGNMSNTSAWAYEGGVGQRQWRRNDTMYSGATIFYLSFSNGNRMAAARVMSCFMHPFSFACLLIKDLAYDSDCYLVFIYRI